MLAETLETNGQGSIPTDTSFVIEPPGAAAVHVLPPQTGSSSVRILTWFRRAGRVTVRNPTIQTDDRSKARRTFVRIHEVRPWPSTPEFGRDVVRAGVGDLSTSYRVIGENTEAGDTVRFRLIISGMAALAVEEVPSLVMRPRESGIEHPPNPDPILVEQALDWGDGQNEKPEREWIYEWRPAWPGRYRPMPFRIVHLDPSGRVQTRLVSGPEVLVEPRAVLRLEGPGSHDRNGRFSTDFGADDGNGPDSFVLVVTIGLMMTIAGLAYFVDWKFLVLRWRIALALRNAADPELALAEWRKIERAFRRGRQRDPYLRDSYAELCRIAFGREPSRAQSIGSDWRESARIPGTGDQNPIR